MPLPVSPGAPLNIPADLWNILQEIAVNERARRDGRAGGPAVRDSVLPNWQVKVRNSSGSNRSPWDVLTVDSALCSPDAEPLGWLKRPILDGLSPVAGKTVCVLLDGAAPDDLVTAVIGGLAVVNLDVVSTGDLWADLVAGDAAKLRSGASGPARVLWKQSGTTGVTLAVVLLVPGVGAPAAGGGTEKVATKTADFTVASTDEWTLFLVDCSGAGISVTATLPSLATGTNAGFRVGFQKTDSSTKQLNINTSTGSGVTSLTEQSDGCVLEWSGSAWVVLSRNTRQLLNVASATYQTYTNPTTTFTRSAQQWYGGHQSFTATGNDTTSVNANWHTGLFNVVTSGFTVTVLLPAVSSGFWCRVRRSGATGSVGVNAGSGNIDGSTTYTLPGDRKCVTLYCLAANQWTVIGLN